MVILKTIKGLYKFINLLIIVSCYRIRITQISGRERPPTITHIVTLKSPKRCMLGWSLITVLGLKIVQNIQRTNESRILYLKRVTFVSRVRSGLSV